MRLWEANEIGRIASMVGVPITTDKVTQEKTYTSFARVLIEIDASKPPVLQFPIVPPSGKEYLQRVIYETYPSYCCQCKKFGHHYFTCNVLNPPKKMEEGTAKGKTVPLVNKNEKPSKVDDKGKAIKPSFQVVKPRNTNSFKLPDFLSKAIDDPKSKYTNGDFEWEGRHILSVHDMEADDIVTKFLTKEDGRHEAWVKKRYQIKSIISVARVGMDLKREAHKDAPAIAFTDPCLVSLPGVKRARFWYAINRQIFILNVACFFDVHSRHNKEYLQAMERTKLVDKSAKDFAQTKGAGASTSEASKPQETKAYTLLPWRDPITGQEITQDAVVEPEGHLIRNTHQMNFDGVVTGVFLDERKKRVVSIMPLDVLKVSPVDPKAQHELWIY
ncbi:unnamed protein product [Cuscuta europaea]|uniref:DUF4283 domain-containing protein n=1 Tax=Cuscuta europaea TaxID=41803 RepID=A0A9P0YZS0_CUSEU|nr:unnamed protein product [Cuscuta europaea]